MTIPFRFDSRSRPVHVRDKGVVGLSGGHVGDYLISVVTVNPGPGSLYEGQFYGIWRTNCGDSFGDGVEDSGGKLGHITASCSINHCIDGSQQRLPRVDAWGITDNRDDFGHDEYGLPHQDQKKDVLSSSTTCLDLELDQ